MFYSFVFWPSLTVLISFIAILGLKISSFNKNKIARWLINILFALAIFAEIFFIMRYTLLGGMIVFYIMCIIALIAFTVITLFNWLINKFAHSNKLIFSLILIISIFCVSYFCVFIFIYKSDKTKILYNDAYTEALSTQNADACLKMKGSGNLEVEKNRCLINFAIKTGTAAACEKQRANDIESLQKKIDSCYMNIALIKNNVRLCDKVQTNPTLCPEIISLFNKALKTTNSSAEAYATFIAPCVDKDSELGAIIKTEFFKPFYSFQRHYEKFSIDMFNGAAFNCVSKIARINDDPQICSVLPAQHTWISDEKGNRQPVAQPRQDCITGINK